MATMDLKPGKPQLKSHDIAKGDVSGLIGMVGPKTKGSLSITFESPLILEIMHKMLGENLAALMKKLPIWLVRLLIW